MFSILALSLHFKNATRKTFLIIGILSLAYKLIADHPLHGGLPDFLLPRVHQDLPHVALRHEEQIEEEISCLLLLSWIISLYQLASHNGMVMLSLRSPVQEQPLVRAH